MCFRQNESLTRRGGGEADTRNGARDERNSGEGHSDTQYPDIDHRRGLSCSTRWAFCRCAPAIRRAGEEYSSAPGSHLTVIGDTIVAADFNFATEANVCFAKAEM